MPPNPSSINNFQSFLLHRYNEAKENERQFIARLGLVDGSADRYVILSVCDDYIVVNKVMQTGVSVRNESILLVNIVKFWEAPTEKEGENA